MNILIVGCGRVGSNIVRMLEKLGHEVSVVDENSDNIDKLNDFTNYTFNGMAVIGVPIDVDVLRSAGIENCDAVAAVTPDDNINIMVGQVAKTVFKVPRVITRVTDPSRKEVFTERFGMAAICSTNLTAHAMVTGLLEDDDVADHTLTIGSSTANFINIPVKAEEYGKSISSAKPPREGCMLYGILRANNTLELAQHEIIMHAGDKIIFTEITD